MKRIWYTAWPFLAVFSYLACVLWMPAQYFIEAVGPVLAVVFAILVGTIARWRWINYEDGRLKGEKLDG